MLVFNVQFILLFQEDTTHRFHSSYSYNRNRDGSGTKRITIKLVLNNHCFPNSLYLTKLCVQPNKLFSLWVEESVSMTF